MKAIFTFIAALMCGAAISNADELALSPLFNGRDLSGWKGDGYAVEDGNLVCTPKGRVLMTEETFANYVLDFEFLLAPGANNGLGIHYPGTGDSAYSGMEIQILDSARPDIKKLKDYQLHGGLYTLAAARQGALKPAGEWNQQRVTVMGPAVKVELNGQIILRANLDDLAAKNPKHEGVKRRSGHIAWLGHGDRVAFRNIRIGELPPVANEAAVEAAGFIRMFDGNSLKGWKHLPETANWNAINGILKHNGKASPSTDLWTEKPYGAFTLVFDWRWSGRGPLRPAALIQPDGSESGTAETEEFNSGILLRGNAKSLVDLWNRPIGSGGISGYRTDPAMPADVRASSTPKVHADLPAGEWNRAMIVMKGDRLSVSLNGRVVIENAQLPGIPAKGPIGLKHQGSAIDFANLWIREE